MLSSPDWKLTLVTNHRVSLQCPTTKYPCSAQPQSIPAVPNNQVSLQCPTAEYPCSAQPQSILTLPNRKVSLQCSTTKYPRSAQPMSSPALPNCKVSLQCRIAEGPCSVQPPNIPAGPNRKIIPAALNRRVSLECTTTEHQYSCNAFAVLQGRHSRGAGKRDTSCAITALGWGCSK